MSAGLRIMARLGRAFLLIAIVFVGTILLTRLAPGYLTDAAELDPLYAQQARLRLEQHAATPARIMLQLSSAWAHGDFGESRQYSLPVASLLAPRIGKSLALLTRGILTGWLLAFCGALPFSSSARSRSVTGVPFTLLLAVPVGAMSTLCLLFDSGGPVLVLSLLIAARDFKFLSHALEAAWRSPCLLQARSQGISPARIFRVHMLPSIIHDLRTLLTMSIVTALSAFVPVEVLFDVPGLGQAAWSAAINRDLPVLVAITMTMTLLILCAGMISDVTQKAELV